MISKYTDQCYATLKSLVLSVHGVFVHYIESLVMIYKQVSKIKQGSFNIETPLIHEESSDF